MIRALVSIVLAAFALASTGCVALNQAESYDGEWQGTWTLSDDTAAGEISMSLSHDRDRVTGAVDIGGTLCIGSANLDATVAASGLSGTFTNGVGAVDIDGAIDAGDEFAGTFEVTSGLCNGAHGTFTMHH